MLKAHILNGGSTELIHGCGRVDREVMAAIIHKGKNVTTTEAEPLSLRD